MSTTTKPYFNWQGHAEKLATIRRRDDASADEEEAFLTDWAVDQGIPVYHGQPRPLRWDSQRAEVVS